MCIHRGEYDMLYAIHIHTQHLCYTILYILCVILYLYIHYTIYTTEHIVKSVLKSTVYDMIEVNKQKNHIGSAMAGSVG